MANKRQNSKGNDELFIYKKGSIVREARVTGTFTLKIDGDDVPCYTLVWSATHNGPDWMTQGGLINYSEDGYPPLEPYNSEYSPQSKRYRRY